MYFLGLAGYPLEHSSSPRLHTAALRACNLEGEYKLYSLECADGLRPLLARVRAGEIWGLNVTIPYKRAVMPLLDELTPTARAIGSVNVIYWDGSDLVGDNTDAPGFWAALAEMAFDHAVVFPENRRALVLGAGGAARAVVYALAQHGWNVHIAARRLSQARQLAADLGSFFPAAQFSTSTFRVVRSPDCELVVNATPVGSAALNTDVSPWPRGWQFPPRAIVYDLVYSPLETVFVHQARIAGLPARTGLSMLIEQAALAFELWTGEMPPRNVMRAAVGVKRASPNACE